MKKINPRVKKVYLFEPDGSCVVTSMVSSKSYMYLDSDKRVHPAWVSDSSLLDSKLLDVKDRETYFQKMTLNLS